MLVEGRGDVAPHPVTIKLTGGDLEMIDQIARHRERYRGYGNRSDTWGRGLISDPTKVGLAGEHALCTFLNRRAGTKLKLDTRDLRRGDGDVDVIAFGLSIQVKTRLHTSRTNMVRRFDSRKGLCGFTADVFVFTRWTESERTVDLLGWITRLGLMKNGDRRKSRRAPHQNVEISDGKLLRMSMLLDELEVRRCA